MEHIWAPWGMQNINIKKPSGCIFCDKPKEDRDAENYILYHGKLNFVILNSYPYNPGHLMVVPYRHISTPEDLTAPERHDHYDLISRCVSICREVFTPAGFNLGMNLGRVAGAGIADHCHTHLVPRWDGDTNWMPVIADTRVLPEALTETYDKLKGKF